MSDCALSIDFGAAAILDPNPTQRASPIGLSRSSTGPILCLVKSLLVAIVIVAFPHAVFAQGEMFPHVVQGEVHTSTAQGEKSIPLSDGVTKLSFPRCGPNTYGYGDTLLGRWVDTKGHRNFEVWCHVGWIEYFLSATGSTLSHYTFKVSFGDGTVDEWVETSIEVDECEYINGANDVQLEVVNGELKHYYHANWSNSPKKENRDFHDTYDYDNKQTFRVDTIRKQQPDGSWKSEVLFPEPASGIAPVRYASVATRAEFRNSGVLDIRAFNVRIATANGDQRSSSIHGPVQTMDAVTWDRKSQSLVVHLKRGHAFPKLSLAIPVNAFGQGSLPLRVRVDQSDKAIQQAMFDDLVLLNIPISRDARSVSISANDAVNQSIINPIVQHRSCNVHTVAGPYIGGEIIKNWGSVRSVETLASTDIVTNRFSDSGDPVGVGIVVGYNFTPWSNTIVVGPFASFDHLNQTINHNFAGGQFLGTTTHWTINLGAKAGAVITPGVYLYGLAGAAWLNQTLNINFATSASSTVTTPGVTLGLGSEYQPSSWSLLGNPVSLFLQYQHTWWAVANFNMPASSPSFNYAFKREDDTIKLGVNVRLSH